MTREIKFRAWDKEKKQMTILESQYVSEALHYYEKGLHELMQYTGLLDKNGKEIYEGDIVNTDWKIREIKWGENSCEDCLFQTFGFTSYGDHTKKYGGWMEVIGNIYENPELLENQ